MCQTPLMESQCPLAQTSSKIHGWRF